MKRIINAIIALILICGSSYGLWAGIWMPVPITVLQGHADVIAIGTLQSVNADSKHNVTSRVQVTKLLKGSVSSPLVDIQMVSSPLMKSNGSMPQDAAGVSGLWFLKRTNGGYSVLPLAQGDYTLADAFLPVESTTASTVTGTIEQQLLAILVDWYKSLSLPSPIDDQRLLVSLDHGSGQNALAAAGSLATSPIPSQRVIGLAAAVRLGSDAALSTAAGEIALLERASNFARIPEALGIYYQPHGNSSITPLQQIITLRSTAPGLDAAAGAALQKIGTKAVLPVMAQLFDSSDPTAQLRADWFFGYYTLFADAHGVIPGTQEIGPLASAATRSHMPRANSDITTEQYTAFWKQWWSEHRTALGFP
jgi:hypothetical protein